MHRRFGGLHRIVLIVNRGCGTGEVVDFIDLDVPAERSRHLAHEFEARVCKKMLNVALGPREKVVDAKDFMSIRQQPVNQMGAKKAGSRLLRSAFGYRNYAPLWSSFRKRSQLHNQSMMVAPNVVERFGIRCIGVEGNADLVKHGRPSPKRGAPGELRIQHGADVPAHRCELFGASRELARIWRLIFRRLQVQSRDRNDDCVRVLRFRHRLR